MKCELCKFWIPLHGATGDCVKHDRITMATDACPDGEADDL
ncbi:MAG TPA: hypothetical protein VMW88_03135 [Thermoplasmata archaeon]|nr:hypothetical protein [Thermoplasmata archaeon]